MDGFIGFGIWMLVVGFFSSWIGKMLSDRAPGYRIFMVVVVSAGLFVLGFAGSFANQLDSWSEVIGYGKLFGFLGIPAWIVGFLSGVYFLGAPADDND